MAPQAALNTQDITEKARRSILQQLEGVRGRKNLVIQKDLLGPLGLFIKFSTLQEYGVDKLFVLENKNAEPSQKNIVFLVRGEKPKQVQAVADQIKQLRKDSQTDHDFSVIWVPRRTLISNRILEEAGVLGEVNMLEGPMYFLSLEPDLLSLELEDAFNDIYLRKDPTPIFLSARALMGVQKTTGLFPRILGKGDTAKKLTDMLLRMRAEEDVDASSDPTTIHLSGFGTTPSSVVDNLIVIDREADFPTALLTQLTYEGLIEEYFGIRNNQTEVDTSIIGSVPQPQQQQNVSNGTSGPQTAMKRKVQLDSSDKMYPTLRDANFGIVGPLLNKTARRLQSDYETRHKADQSISDLKSFVAKLPSYQAEQASLKTHTALAEELMKTTQSDLFARTLEVQQNLVASTDSPSAIHDNIETLIARDVPLPTILRLLCLESCVSSGLRARDLENFKRLILHAYGPQHLLTFSALERIGLLTLRTANTGYLNPMAATASGTATDYASVRKSLKLFVDDVDEAEPQDIAYVFSGYAPLSVRIVQCALQKSYVSSLTTAKPSAKDATTPTFAPGAQAQSPGWKGFEDVLARIKGTTVDEVQTGADKEASRVRLGLKGTASTGSGVTTSIVFFLGGITYAEIAALRFVGKQLGEKRKLLIATTGIISGDRVVGVAIEKGNLGGK